jgi:hypothetical protein
LPGEARGLVAPAELFGAAAKSDADAVQIGDFRFRLGWPQWVFGLLGALTLLRRGPHARVIAFFGLLAAGCVFLMLPASAWLWRAVPPLAYLQFAWRLLGPAALGLALLAGAATEWGRALPHRLGQPAAACALVAGCLLALVPLLDPLPWPNFGPVDGNAIVDLELSGRWGVGTTHGIEFMPRAVQWAPKPHPDVIAAYRAGTVEKVDRGQLPAGTTVAHTAHGVLHDVFVTDSAEPFTLRLLTHDFPGWTAYLDDQRVPHQVTEPEGWIAVRVPAGAHSLALRLVDTAPRRLGWAVAAVSALTLLGVVAWPRRWRANGLSALPDHLTPRLALAMTGLFGIALLLPALGVYRLRLPPIDNLPALARFEGNLVLAHFDLPHTRLAPGSAFPLTLYWYAVAPAPQPVSVFVHVYNADGALWGQADQLDPLANFPATRWRPFALRPAEHSVRLFPETPPGRYRLAAGLWQRTTGARSAVLDASGAPTAQTFYVLTEALEVVAQ